MLVAKITSILPLLCLWWTSCTSRKMSSSTSRRRDSNSQLMRDHLQSQLSGQRMQLTSRDKVSRTREAVQATSSHLTATQPSQSGWILLHVQYQQLPVPLHNYAWGFPVISLVNISSPDAFNKIRSSQNAQMRSHPKFIQLLTSQVLKSNILRIGNAHLQSAWCCHQLIDALLIYLSPQTNKSSRFSIRKTLPFKDQGPNKARISFLNHFQRRSLRARFITLTEHKIPPAFKNLKLWNGPWRC